MEASEKEGGNEEETGTVDWLSLHPDDNEVGFPFASVLLTFPG
jgi:hypothetical protein